MEEEKIVRQLIQFHNTCLENAWRTMAILHEHAECMVEMFMAQTADLPPEGKEVIAQWIATCRQGREQCVSARRESYRKIEEYFGGEKS